MSQHGQIIQNSSKGGTSVAVTDPTVLLASDNGNTSHSNDGNTTSSLNGNTVHSNDGNTTNNGAGSGDTSVTAHSNDGNTSNSGTLAGATGSLDHNAAALNGSAYDQAANDGNSGYAGATGVDNGNQNTSGAGGVDSGNTFDKASGNDNGNASVSGGSGSLYDKAANDGNSGNAGAIASGNDISGQYALAHDVGNTTTTSIDIGNLLSHSFNDYNNTDGATLVMPQDITQSISGGGGTNAMIALDQINSLVSNNSAYDNTVTDNNTGNSSSQSYMFGDNSVHAGGGTADGNHGTDALSASANSTASITAFTQSIVLGANLQNNSFSTNVSGHDTANDGGIIHHS